MRSVTGTHAGLFDILCRVDRPLVPGPFLVFAFPPSLFLRTWHYMISVPLYLISQISKIPQGCGQEPCTVKVVSSVNQTRAVKENGAGMGAEKGEKQTDREREREKERDLLGEKWFRVTAHP